MKPDAEIRTLKAVISLYCRIRHGADEELCLQCHTLLEYAKERTQKCPFGKKKPVCEKCNVHCYKPDMRKQMKEIMRFSGPRMMFMHPWLTMRHLYKKFTRS